MGLVDLRDRLLTDLSGGQQQRVAIAAALATHPAVLVQDQPTSALDPVAAEEVLSALHRLVHDVGTTVVVAEHRLERVVHHADAVVLVGEGSVSGLLDPAEAMRRSAIRPPLVDLGLLLGWEPLPLSIRDARRRLRAGGVPLPGPADAPRTAQPADGGERQALQSARGLGVVRGSVVALREVSLDLHPGEVVALMGRNGAGKSSLLSVLAGGTEPTRGVVTAAPEVRVGRAAQDPSWVVGDDEATVANRLHEADADHGLPAGTSAAVLGRLAPDLAPDLSPSQLSEGQRMALALAITLAPDSDVLLLDEPTRGLDYAAKARLVELVLERAASGSAVVVATHDVELAAALADTVAVLAEGEVVAHGPTREILVGSPAFAPQVAKVAHPAALLTVAEVRAALA
jgi:energy-coupling factor transport system ATP-binding protein